MVDILEAGPWWDSGVLDPSVHTRLVQNRHAIAERSGLGEANLKYVWEPLPKEVTPVERKWLTKVIRQEPVPRAALALYGVEMNVRERAAALTGALLRNFIDTQMLTVEELAQRLYERKEVNPTVLMVTDFAFDGGLKSQMPRSADAVQSLLVHRIWKREPVVICGPTLKAYKDRASPRFQAALAAQLTGIEV